MNPLALNKNKSTIFILPMVFDNLKHTDILTEDYANAYIADFETLEFDDDLIVVYNDKAKAQLQSAKALGKTTFTYKDQLAQVYEIPEKYLVDYFKVIAGQYSSISEGLKQVMLSFWENDEKSSLYRVLYAEATDDLDSGIIADKVNELLPAFSLSEEVYRMGSLS